MAILNFPETSQSELSDKNHRHLSAADAAQVDPSEYIMSLWADGKYPDGGGAICAISGHE